MEPLTDRQHAVLQFICYAIESEGYPPTLREIGNRLGIRSTNGVNDHLRALVRKGYLTRRDMKSRALCPTAAAFRLSRVGPGSLDGTDLPVQTDVDEYIPLLGRVAAGSPTEALEVADDSVRIERWLNQSQQRDVFGLRVQGDAMAEAGICDGDYVLVRKQLEAKSGEIAIVVVGDHTTCRYYHPQADEIRLDAASPKFPPMVIPRDAWRSTQLLGVVVAMYRRLM